MKALLISILFLAVGCGTENSPKDQEYNNTNAEFIGGDDLLPDCQTMGYVVYSDAIKQYLVCQADGWHVLLMSPDGEQVSGIN